MLEHSDPVHKVSIISRGQALGYTISLPTEDKFLTTRAELSDTMAMTLGGRAAEEIIFSEITTGASNDLEKVTATAKQMVMRFGMSERLGPRVFGHDRSQPFLGRDMGAEPDYSDEVAREIDDEIRRIVEEAHQRAREILTDNREGLDRISKILLERETIEAERVRRPARGQARGGGLPARRGGAGDPRSARRGGEEVLGPQRLPPARAAEARPRRRRRGRDARGRLLARPTGGRVGPPYRRVKLMGVLNVTPDSFSDGGEFLDAERAIAHGRELAAEGADILDVGGESTRPGAAAVDAAEELRAGRARSVEALAGEPHRLDRHLEAGGGARRRSTPEPRSSTT